MKIGILGVSHIGKTLALKLAKVGHQLYVANSSVLENIDSSVLANEAIAVTAHQAVQNKEVIILSIPLNNIKEVASIFKNV